MERSVARTAAMPAASMGLALLVGVLAVQWMPSLPPRWCTLLLLALASLLAWRWPRGRWVGCILIGVAWAMFRGGLAMDARLPRSLEGRDLVVIGTIVDLPLKRDYASVRHVKPASSRQDSSERYVLAMGFRGLTKPAG